MWEANAQICINPAANQEQQLRTVFILLLWQLFQSIPSPVLVKRQYQKSRNHRRNDHPLKPSPTPHQRFDCTRTDQAPHAAIIFPGTSASNKSLSLSLICKAGRIFQRSRRVCRVKRLIPLQGKSPTVFRRAWGILGLLLLMLQNFGKDPVEVGQSMFHSYTSKHLLVCTWNPETYLNTITPGGMTGCIGIYRLTYLSIKEEFGLLYI